MELFRRLFLDARDEFIGKVLAAGVEDLGVGIVPGDLVADGVKQMRFAETRVTVDEQGVVRLRGAFRHRERRRVSKAVAAADHKAFKGILGVQVRIRVGRFGVIPVQSGVHLVPGQQRHLDRFSGRLGGAFVNQRGIFTLHRRDGKVHLDGDIEMIPLQQSRGHVSVHPGAVGDDRHFLREKGAGLVP